MNSVGSIARAIVAAERRTVMLAITPRDLTEPSTALIARVARSDRAAFETLARRLHGNAARIAVRVLGPGPDAEDAVQAAFLNLWRKAGQFDAARGAVEPWFNRLVANACLDRRRMIRPAVALDDIGERASEEPQPDALAENADERTRVAAAIARLNPRQRAAIQLFYGEDATTAEVADVLETSPKAVEGLLARARLELHRILVEMGYDRVTEPRR